MILHKLLRGADAGKYLPFGLSRLRALAAIHGSEGFFQQKYKIAGYTIEVQQTPPFQYVRIAGGASVQYEFFTSDHVLTDPCYAAPEYEDGIANSFLTGALTRARFGGPSATSAGTAKRDTARGRGIYATSIAPGDGDGWTLRPADTLQGSGDGSVITRRAWQNQKFFEHTWWPDNGNDGLVTSTQAHAPGLASKCGWMSPYRVGRVAAAGSQTSDWGLDVAPTLHNAGGSTTGAPALEYAWLYWRHAAVQKAGGRQFFISTDNYGRFQVYPVKDYGDDKFAIPAAQYKTFTPPYPAWVTVPTPSDHLKQANDWLWRFNKDATKCVSLPFHAEETEWLKYVANLAFTGAILPEESSLITPQAALFPAYEGTPGLTEFGIAIAVTGDGDMDFDVTFTLLRSSYFDDDNRFFFDAAYFLKDADGIGIAEDTLMTAEIECFCPPGGHTAGPFDTGSGTVTEGVDAVDGLDSYVVINANDAAMTPTEKFRKRAWWSLGIIFPTIDAARAGAAGASVGQYVPVTPSGTAFFSSAGPVGYMPIGSTYGGTVFYLYALELATLSLVYEQDNSVTGTYELKALAYGTEIYSNTGSYTAPKLTPPHAAASYAIPSARVHQYVLDIALNTEFGQGFSAHPAGHYALAVNAELGSNATIAAALDQISVKGVDANGDPIRWAYTHRELYNEAFGQARAQSYYTAAFTGKTLYDQGSFRTAGFWVTFR